MAKTKATTTTRAKTSTRTRTKTRAKAKAKAKAKTTTTRRKPAPPSTLTAQQSDQLSALPDDLARDIDHPITDTLQEALELAALVRKYGQKLHARSRLTPAVSGSLTARRALLASAELSYSLLSHPVLTRAELKKARTEAETLRSDGVAALRHFFEDDGSLQAQVSALPAGRSLAAQVGQLSTLAGLLDEHALGLTKADLPASAPERLRELARMLGQTGAEQRAEGLHSEEEVAALELRRRAFWYLRQAMDAVRSAGRYVFRKQPAIRRLFAPHPAHTRPHRAAAPAPEKAAA
jgi:hypothetical protein